MTLPLRSLSAPVTWAGALLILAIPHAAAAQSRPPADDQQEPGAVSVAAPPPPWQLTLRLQGGYDTNVNFATANDAGDYSGSFRASVGRNWRSPRGQMSLVAGGTAVAYRELTDASHLDGSLGLSVSHRLSPKVGFRFGAFGAYQSTDNAPTLTTLGLQLPRSQSLSYGGSTGFDFKLGQRTSLRTGASYDGVTFEDARLVDSQSMSASVSLGHRFGPRDEIGLSYGFLRSKDKTRDPLDTHFAALNWSRTLSRHVSLGLSGGAGYNPAFKTRSDQWYFHGSLGLQGQWRHASVRAQVAQSVTPAYGLGGNQLADTASVSATLPFGRNVHVSLGGNHTWGRQRSGGAAYVSDGGELSLDVKLFRHAGLTVGYGYRRYDPEGSVAAVSGHHASFGLTYTRP